ncbi:Transcriptional regulator calD [Cladobotryum mycophilum]|uniref:Transcriptional regulator calD n=1 Tax=Cladobotryum mycophilum TaxID=491253 RepID=A0ABR0SI85_9HYPO
MAPPRVPTDRVVPVLPYDSSMAVLTSKIHVLLAYNAVLDPERLRDTLWSVVEREGWERLGARLRRVGLTGLEFHIPVKFTLERPAINFSQVTHDTSIASHPEACHLVAPIDTETIKTYPAPIEGLILPEGSPVNLFDYLSRDIPLLGIHVVSFRDAAVVVFYLPHMLLDGTGIIATLNAWTMALHGEDCKIPTPIAMDVDPLASIKPNPNLLKPTRHFPWVWTGLSWGRYVLAISPRLLFSSRVFKTIIVPPSQMKRLRERAIQELAAERGTVKDGRPATLSDGDVLAAWWLRLELSHLPKHSKQKVSLVNAVALRQFLPGEADPKRPDSKIVFSNIFDFVRVIMDADYIKNQPLGQVANRIRTILRKAQTPERLESFATWWKTSRLTCPKLFGTSDMYVIGFSNMTMGKFFKIDLLGAAVDRETRSSPLNPSNVQLRVTGASPFNGTWIAGKDDNNNYWLNCGTWSPYWPKIEEALAKENMAAEAIPMRVLAPIRARL